MKNRWKKIALITGICTVMSLAVYGCGGSGADDDSNEVISAEDISGQDDATDEKGGGQAGQDLSSEEDASFGEETPSKENGTDTDASAQEELYGDITELKGDGTFVVNKIYNEELDDGSEIMVIGNGEKNKELITVQYDDKTVFIYQTIWNGGADHEEKESSADELAKGLTAEMKGYYEGEEFHAVQIQLVEVIL